MRMAVLVRCCSVGVLANDNSSLTKETRLLQSFFKYISLSADVKQFTSAIFLYVTQKMNIGHKNDIGHKPNRLATNAGIFYSPSL